MKKIGISFFIFHFSFFVLQVGVAQIIHVPADQPTIQAGIDAANDGDTVLVAEGTYLENISFAGKAITVASQFIMDADPAHIDNTVIDGSQPVNPVYGSTVVFTNGEDTTSVLCGFTITGGSGSPEPTYDAIVGGGIFCFNAGAKITNNKITGNEINGPNYAFGGGLACVKDEGDYWLVLENNLISYNDVSVTNNFATGGGCEIWINARICNNMVEFNTTNSLLGNAAGAGMYIGPLTTPLTNLVFHNNFISYNTATSAMGASGGGVIAAYVDASITNNFFMNNTISGTNSSSVATAGGLALFYSESYVAENSFNSNTVNGFEADGGGLQFYYPGHTECINNVIFNNTVNADSVWFGAGLAYFFPEDGGMIAGNEFNSNSGPVEPIGAGGGLSLLDAEGYKITISDNQFLGNTAYHGGGIYERSSWNLYISNNIFIQNNTFRGGAIGIYHPATSENLLSREYQPMIINNTFFQNSASSDGGAIRFQGDLNAPQVYNSIFWENTAPAGRDIRNWSAQPVTVSYSDIDTNYINGAWTGEQNIFADPLFMNPICHIMAASPCRDVGFQSLYTPPVDFDGEPRPDPVGGVDIGADEFYDEPDAPVALYPEEIGVDYFVANWTGSLWAVWYELDVAYDENFDNLVPGYENLNTGKDTFALVSGLAPDEYYFRVRAANTQYTSENSNTILVLSVGLEETGVRSSQFAVRSYPNPTDGIVDCQLSIVNCQRVSLRIYDLHGREVMVVLDETLPAGEHVVRYDASGLPAGLYIVSLQAGKEIRTGKIAVVH